MLKCSFFLLNVILRFIVIYFSGRKYLRYLIQTANCVLTDIFLFMSRGCYWYIPVMYFFSKYPIRTGCVCQVTRWIMSAFHSQVFTFVTCLCKYLSFVFQHLLNIDEWKFTRRLAQWNSCRYFKLAALFAQFIHPETLNFYNNLNS